MESNLVGLPPIRQFFGDLFTQKLSAEKKHLEI